MKKNLLIIILSLKSLFLFSEQLPGRWIEKSQEVPEFECLNDDFTPLINSLSEKEKVCDYYSDSLMFSVRIGLYNNNFIFFIESTIKRDIGTLIELNPMGFVKAGENICFLYYNTPDALFKETGNVNTFKYKTYEPPSEYKKGDPIVITSYEDDSFSSWTYVLKNNTFELVEEVQPCIGIRNLSPDF